MKNTNRWSSSEMETKTVTANESEGQFSVTDLYTGAENLITL